MPHTTSPLRKQGLRRRTLPADERGVFDTASAMRRRCTHRPQAAEFPQPSHMHGDERLPCCAGRSGGLCVGRDPGGVAS
jgi:hypothetical protein